MSRARRLTDEYPELTDAAWLRGMYVERELSTHQIAEALGFDVDGATVRYFLVKAGIRLRNLSDGRPDQVEPEARSDDRGAAMSPTPAERRRLEEAKAGALLGVALARATQVNGDLFDQMWNDATPIEQYAAASILAIWVAEVMKRSDGRWDEVIAAFESMGGAS